MKRFILRLIMAFSGVVGIGSAGINEWTSLGPDGGAAGFLAIDPQNSSTVYALTNAGVFKSTDGGGNWRATGAGPAGFQGLLVIDPLVPTTLYAAIYGSGIFKSADGGASWTAVNAVLSGTLGTLINSLAIDPQNSSTLYAATYLGVFKTTNGGASWIAMSSGLPGAPDGYTPALSLAIDPRNSRTLYAVLGHGLFKSTDAGAHWSAAQSGLPLHCFSGPPPLVVDPQDPATLLYADFCEGVFKSTDGGTSWSAVSSGLPTLPNSSNVSVKALAIDPRDTNTYYAATYIGVFKSADGGASWNLANSGLRAGEIATLAVDPQNSGAVYASVNDFSSLGGLFKSTDGAAHWSAISAGLRVIGVEGLVVDSQNSDTLYANAQGSIIKSTDRGTSWNPVHSGYLLALDPKSPAILYAVTAGVVVKSTDRGANWSPANTGLPEGCVYLSSLSIDPQETSTIYAGFREGGDYCPRSGNGGVWKTTDGGTSWARVGSTPSGGGVHGVTIDPKNPSMMYAGNGKGLFKSADAGVSWSPVNSGNVNALAIDTQSPSTLYASIGGSGVFKSTDGGMSWSAVNTGLPETTLFVNTGAPFYPVSTLVIDPQNTSTVYAGTHSGVFKTTDGGAHWSAVNSGLTSLSVDSLAIDPNNASTVYAGAAGGVFVITFTAE